MAAESFDPIYQHILKSEGGLSDRNLRDDPGGRTMMGVTQGTYNSWRASQGLPSQDVAKIAPAEHRTIFKSMFWDPIKGDALPIGLDYALMDTSINAGPSRATRLLQRTLGLDEDGRMGNDTIMAIGNTNPAEILGQYTANRRSWQLALPNADANPGWKTRINDVNSLASNAIKNGGFGDRVFQVPVGQMAGNDTFGKGYNVADGIGTASDGQIGDSGRPVETGNPYGFTGANAAGDVGPGYNNLGTATPIGPAPSSTAYSDANVSGGVGNGTLNPALTPYQPAPGVTDFSGANVAGGVGNGALNPALTPYQPAPSDTAFGGRFDPNAYLAANQDVAADPYYDKNAFQHYLQYGLKEGRAIDARGDRFDPSRYLAQNADVLAAGADPLMHYAQFGAAEGRAAPIVGPDGTVQLVQNFGLGMPIGPSQSASTIRSGAAFNAADYLRLNPDVAASATYSQDPIQHAILFGAKEGRTIDAAGDSLANVDWARYAAENPDVLAANVNPVEHFLRFGGTEGRQIHTMNEAPVQSITDLTPTQAARLSQYGFALNPEYVAGSIGPSQTGLTIGPQGTAPTIGSGPAVQAVGAGQAFRGLDPTEYVKANADVAADATASADPITHFLRFGQAENRPLTLDGQRFDGTAYLAANPDVARAGMNPLQHYLEFGGKEGRQAQTIGPDGITHTIGPDFFAPGVQAPSAQTIASIFSPTIGAPALSPTIGAPSLTPTIGAPQGLTIGAGPAVSAYQGLSPYGFSNANVGGALGATAQGFGDYYGTSNLGMDMSQPQAQAGGVGDFAFSGANVGGFNVNGFNGASQQPSSTTAYGPPTQSVNFNPQASQNAYLDSQINNANASNAALDAFNPAIRNGMFVSSTGNPDIYKAAADYNVATLGINQANLAKPPVAAPSPVTPTRVAQGAFAPAPFVGRW